MRSRLLFKSLASALGLTCLVVACDTPEAPKSSAPASSLGVAPEVAMPESPGAAAVVTRASSFREKGFVLVRDRARNVPQPTERQVVGDASSLQMRVVGGRVVHPGGALQTSFGLNAGEPFAVHDSATGIGAKVALRGATDAKVERAGAFVVYRGGHALGDVLHRVTHKGTEDYVVLEQAPKDASISYGLSLDGGASLRLVANNLELLDSNGSPRVRVASPYLVDSQGTRHVAQLSVTGCAVDMSPVAPWGRQTVQPGAATCELHVDWRGANVAYPALLDPAWQSAGSMAAARSSAAATVLNDGRVLVSGGFSAASLTSAEIFDPQYGTWATTGSFTVNARYGHSSNIVAGGSVLVAGGTDGVTTWSDAQLYNPASGTWAATGGLAAPRDTHASVSLANGTVLVVGGYNGSTGGLATAELFSGAAFAASGSMSSVRQGMAASLQTSGSVLVSGGYDNAGTNLATTDVWTSGAFAAGPALVNARYGHTATLLGSGSVLIAGGKAAASIVASELCAGACVASGSLTTGRAFHTATLMPNGSVLVAGGINATTVLSSVEVYTGGTFTVDNAMAAAREAQIGVLLRQGQALIASGDDGTSALASAEAWPQPTVSDVPGTNQVSVTWGGTPGNPQDWIVVAPPGSPATTFTKFVFTGGAVSGTNLFTGIGAGTYVARVLLNNSYWIAVESAPFTIGGAATTVALNAGSTLTAPGNVIIDYTNMSGAQLDWISIATPASPDTSFVAYQYTNGNLNGQATFANVPAGTYQARAYFNNTYTRQATSANFTVTSAGATTLLLDGASVLTTPSSIRLDFTNMSGAPQDWISIAVPGSLDTQYISYQFTGGPINGNVTFANLPAGTYVGRAYFNNTYTKQAETAPFTITGTGPSVTINVGLSIGTAPGTIVIDYANMSGASDDWISIAPSGSADTVYTQYIFTGGALSGRATFTAVGAGLYVGRAYFNNTYVKQAQTATTFQVN